MPDDDIFIPSDPTPWIELSALLHTARRQLPNSPWKIPLKSSQGALDPSRDEVKMREQAADLVAEHGPEAVKASVQWFAERQWPAMSQEALYFAAEMLASASAFVESAILGKPGEETTIFPFPKMPIQNVFLWLVTQWWGKIGAPQWIWSASSPIPRYRPSDS